MKKNNSQKGLLKESFKELFINEDWADLADPANRDYYARIDAERAAAREAAAERAAQQRAAQAAADRADRDERARARAEHRAAEEAVRETYKNIREIQGFLKEPDNQKEETQNELKDLLKQATEKLPEIQKISMEIKNLEEKLQTAQGIDKFSAKSALKKAIEAKESEIQKILSELGGIQNQAATVSESFKIKRWQKLAGMRLLKEELDPNDEIQIDDYLDQLALRVAPEAIASDILGFQENYGLDISEIINYIENSEIYRGRAGVTRVIETLRNNMPQKMPQKENLSSEEEEIERQIALRRAGINP